MTPVVSAQVRSALEAQPQLWVQATQTPQQSQEESTQLRHAYQRWVLVGVGSSWTAAALAAEWVRPVLNVPVLALRSDQAGLKAEPFLAQKGDLWVGFSHRGKSEVTADCLRRAQQRGAHTAWVTAAGVVPPLKAQYHWTAGPLEGCEPHTQAITTAVAALTLAVDSNHFFSMWQKAAAQGAPPALHESVWNAVHPVVLGTDVGEVLAVEASLKLMEMLNVPVRAYSTESFFHGPHLAPVDWIWHLATSEDPRTESVLKFNRPLLTTTVDSSDLGSLNALVEIQWQVMRWAQAMGK